MDMYQYTPLRADLSGIRVMTLRPGEFESPIIVSISVIALAEIDALIPSLEALSYAWGPLYDCVDITVKGNKHGTLSITANLAEALMHLRNSTAARLLWTDAICINQQDLEERGRQVRFMAKIYSKARRVVLWVGPKSDDSNIAMDYISATASRVKVHWQTTQLVPLTEESEWADLDVPLPISDVEYAALFRFYSHSWFERLWVWQEVHLAADALLLCSFRSLDWKAVRTGVICLGLKPRPGMVEWPAPEAALSICAFAMTENYALSDLSHETKESKCSDPRDRVYALLSFLNPDIQSRIVPNYNMSAQEVYKDVVLQHFEMGHRDGPRLLSTVEIRKEEPGGPSWVSRWDLPRLANMLYYGKAALGTVPCINRLSATVVEALGVHVTTIGKVEPINLPDDVRQEAMIDELRRLKEQFLPDHGQNSYRQDIYPFLETLTANYVAERHHPPYSWRPSTENFQPFLEIVFGGNNIQDPLVERLLRNIREFGPGRALCRTTDQQYCLSLLGTKPGDIVVVLLGCDSPIVLRPTT